MSPDTHAVTNIIILIYWTVKYNMLIGKYVTNDFQLKKKKN